MWEYADVIMFNKAGKGSKFPHNHQRFTSLQEGSVKTIKSIIQEETDNLERMNSRYRPLI